MSNLYKEKGTYNVWSKYVWADFRDYKDDRLTLKIMLKTMLTVKKHTT